MSLRSFGLLAAGLLALAAAALGISGATRIATAQEAGVANVAPAPPPGGLTQVLAGTTDIQALIDAQTFAVESVWKLDIATQGFLSYVVGAPAFVNTLSSLDPADIVTIKAAPTPFAMTYLGAKPDLAPLGSDLISHVFLVEGFDLWSVPRDDITAAFKRPLPNAGWTLRDAHPDWLVLYMEPSTTAGTYEVALELSDGRRAEATFEHPGAEPSLTALPTPTVSPPSNSEPLLISYHGSSPDLRDPNTPGMIPYAFRVAGFDLWSVPPNEVGEAFRRPFDAPWTLTNIQRDWLILYMEPSAATGTYEVTLALRDGRKASAAFEHPAPEPWTTTPPSEPWPPEIELIFAVLPMPDGLHLFVSEDGCSSFEGTGCGIPERDAVAHYVDALSEVVLSELRTRDFSYSQSLRIIAHEICHAHQHRIVVEAGLYNADPLYIGLNKLGR